MIHRSYRSRRRAAEREVMIRTRLTDAEFAAFERRRGDATRSAFLRAVLQDPSPDTASGVSPGAAVRPFTAPPRTALRGGVAR